MSYDAKTIQVLVMNSQGGIKRVRCKCDQNIVKMKDGTTINFKLKDVRPVWCPGIIRGGWQQGIMWRAGTEDAINMDVNDQFVPLLSQAGTTRFIERTTANAVGAPKKAIETWEFYVLLIAVIAVAVMCALSLFGVQFNASTTTTTIIQNQTITVTPRPFT